jgi:putative ABC transport system permease protein
VIHSGHKLTLSFLSLAMGATLISLILQLDRMIQSEFTLGEKKPSLFIFDIQEDQIDALKQFALSKKVHLEGVSPLIRARIEKINGKAFLRQTESTSLRTREDEVDSRFRNRGLNLTYREELSAAEKIVAGKAFFKESPLPEGWAQISLEKRFAKRMGIEIGDRLSFDIQGIPIEGVVLNLREVKWTSFYPNFFVNVAPGTIDEAPKTYLAALPWSPRKMKQDFQREAVDKFPNVSFVDVEELILKLSQLFEKSRLAIEIISWLSLGVGLVILYGLSHDQVYRRFYDLALLKSLGLSSASLLKQLLIEFGFIFFLALFLGLGLGLLMANLIGLEVFKLSWSVDWERIIYPALFLSLMSIVTILLAARNVLKTHPKTLLSDS